MLKQLKSLLNALVVMILISVCALAQDQAF